MRAATIEGWIRRPWARVALALVAAAYGLRVVVAARHFGGMPINYDENLRPLFRHLTTGDPVTDLGPRSYGVVAWLLVDPVVRIFGVDPFALNVWAFILSLAGVGTALFLFARRFQWVTRTDVLLLAVLTLGFSPFVYALATRLVDLVVLGFIGAILYIYTGPRRHEPWTGVSIALGFLTKLLPLLFLPLVALRRPRAAVYAVLGIVLLLAIGHVVYGPLVGFGYLLFLARDGPGVTLVFSLHHENNTLRGLVFKLASGYQLSSDSDLEPPAHFAAVHALAYALQLGVILYLLYVIFKGRSVDSVERRAVEVALGIATMYLAAPFASPEHMVSMLLVFALLLHLWRRGTPRPWSRSLTAAALASLLLMGVYLPLAIAGRVVPLGSLMRWTGNAAVSYAGPNVGSYSFLGFSGYGLVLAWLVLARLERTMRLTPAPTGNVGNAGPSQDAPADAKGKTSWGG